MASPAYISPRLLGSRGADGRLDLLLLLRRRDHSREAEGLDPQLPAPSGGVVQVRILLLLDLLIGFLQRLCLVALECLARNPEQFPVQMVLRFGFDDALAGDELGGFW